MMNAMIGAGLSIRRVEELEAVDAAFWFPYEQLQKQNPEQLENVNCWRRNPMAALPAWIAIAAVSAGESWRAKPV